MNICYGCGRKFVKKVKDKNKECICHKWLIEDNQVDKHNALRFMCHDCSHELKRKTRRRDRAERELTPNKKKHKRKENK